MRKMRGKRENVNVVFHNIPECTSDDTDKCKRYDVGKVEEVLEHLEIDEEQVNLKPVRLGKKTELLAGKPRLMKVTLNSVSTRHARKMLLSIKAKNLRS